MTTSETNPIAALFEANYERIARYAYYHVGNREAAEDIAAEVFVKAAGAWPRYQERGLPVSAWLYRIAHNLVVDYFRREKQATVPLESVTLAANDSPAELAEEQCTREEVRAALRQLTPAQQEVIRLRFGAELSSAEVAKVLGKNDGAVREMQRAAIARLRALLVKKA